MAGRSSTSRSVFAKPAERLEEMVRETVEQGRPLAYVIGAFLSSLRVVLSRSTAFSAETQPFHQQLWLSFLPQVIHPSFSPQRCHRRPPARLRFAPARCRHLILPFDSYTCALAVDALENKRAADVQTVSKSSCAWLLDDSVLANPYTSWPSLRLSLS
jgi:hypothetical protein